MRDILSGLFLLIGLVLVQAPTAMADTTDKPQNTIYDIAIVGTKDSSRITIWSERKLNPKVFLISDPDLATSNATARHLIISGDVPLGPLALGFLSPARTLLSRRAGVRDWGDFNGDLLLSLTKPVKSSRILNLGPMASEARYRTIIDLEGVSEDVGARLAAKQTLAYNAMLARRRTIHMAMAQTPTKQAEPVAKIESAVTTPTVLGAPTPSETPTQKPSQPTLIAQTIPKPTPTALPDPIQINPQIQNQMPPFTIVIDPGHGGYDPGTSRHKVIEKSIVLKAALELKALLETNPDYIVKLTRNEDKFVSLERRVSRARAWKADLFISIHADSIGATYLKGASVYTLSEKGLKRSKSFAQENDWAMPDDIGGGGDTAVAGILSDFAQRETLSKSSIFADVLIEELDPVTDLIRNSHRNAGYVVLFASDVPAVLLEMGFLSNKSDAARLSTKAGRRPTLVATHSAIDRFFQKTLNNPTN